MNSDASSGAAPPDDIPEVVPELVPLSSAGAAGAVSNGDIVGALNTIADLLQFQGVNPFRIRAYRNAARSIEGTVESVPQMVEDGADLTTLEAIGKDLAASITDFCRTGEFGLLEKLTKEVPMTVLDLLRLPGLGPIRAERLFRELGIADLDALAEAARKGELAPLPGFGAKMQTALLESIERGRTVGRLTKLIDADRLILPLIEYMKLVPGLERVDAAGSYRRRVEAVEDVDILAVSTEPAAVVAHFTSYPQVTQVLKSGNGRARTVLGSGLEVDLTVLDAAGAGAALMAFTGSEAHTAQLSRRAIELGLRFSGWGVFRPDPSKVEAARHPFSGDFVAGATESDVYEALGLEWIPPELREDRGEIEAAAERALPQLIELADIKGDLQMHSTWSDGRATIETMVSACEAKGYAYMSITDHSQSLTLTNGLDPRRLRQQWLEIDEVAARHPGIRVFKSMEIDILADGRLDLDDETMEGLDVVVASVHSRFRMPADEQTRRLIRAVSHPKVHFWAHPTGRLINRREPYAFDFDAVVSAAVANRVAVELNCLPDRLDLKDTLLMRARELGAQVIINTDAHAPQDLDLMRYGVEQARRSWLTADAVVNTKPLEAFDAWLEKGA